MQIYSLINYKFMNLKILPKSALKLLIIYTQKKKELKLLQMNDFLSLSKNLIVICKANFSFDRINL